MLDRIIRGLLMLAVAGIITNTAYDFVCDLFKPEVERSINYTVVGPYKLYSETSEIN